MSDVLAFTVTVFRRVCERLAAKAAEVELLVRSGVPFDGWLAREAFLACAESGAGPFGEVSAEPSYASEGATGDPDRQCGDLRVGGPDDGAGHRWLFAEFVVAHDGGGWRRRAEAAAGRLAGLGWKKSAAVLVVVSTTAEGEPLDRPALTAPCVIPLPGGGSVVVRAFDIKRDAADTLALPDGG